MPVTGQFELNFELKKNRFQKSLKKGSFSTFFEVNTPSINSNIKTVLSRMEEGRIILEEFNEFHAGFAISDKSTYSQSYNLVNFASELCKKDRDKHLLFLSGKGVDNKQMTETVNACINLGFNNIVPVSGETLPNETLNNIKNINFFDSVDSLNLINKLDSSKKLFPGCVVSPFKYTPIDFFPQYYKLVKKINMGANFIVAQAGWDLLKYQELRWYLEKREYYDPTLARIIFLTSEMIEPIIEGQYPGIHISPDFLNMLKKESKFGFSQFISAQWRKLQLQVAGLRLMGYSGIVLAGINRADDIKTALNKIDEALDEFKSFDDWKDTYLNYLGRSEMAPYPHRFYFLKNLFNEAFAEIPDENYVKIPDCTKIEKVKYHFSKKRFLKSKQKGKRSGIFLKSIMSNSPGFNENDSSLSQTQFVSTNSCPKKLSNGPCGGTKADGTCEVCIKECVFSKIFRLANWQNDLDLLEEYNGEIR